MFFQSATLWKIAVAVVPNHVCRFTWCLLAIYRCISSIKQNNLFTNKTSIRNTRFAYVYKLIIVIPWEYLIWHLYCLNCRYWTAHARNHIFVVVTGHHTMYKPVQTYPWEQVRRRLARQILPGISAIALAFNTCIHNTAHEVSCARVLWLWSKEDLMIHNLRGRVVCCCSVLLLILFYLWLLLFVAAQHSRTQTWFKTPGDHFLELSVKILSTF